MNLDPQLRVARRSRWLAPAAFVLMAGGWGVGPAWADIYVHVMNCTEDTVEAQAFDANDSVKAVAASTAKFSFGNPGKSEQLHCAGEGEGYCQMIIGNSDLANGCTGGEDIGHVDFHLDSGKWAVITGFESSGGECRPIVKENLDSGSCG